MKLENKSTGKVISNKVSKRGTQGLMFSRKLQENESVLLDISRESRLGASVHMLFVFFPIDVVWLDNEMKVVDIAKNLLPFTPFRMPRRKARYILEMTSGSTEEKEIRIGDLMKLN